MLDPPAYLCLTVRTAPHEQFRCIAGLVEQMRSRLEGCQDQIGLPQWSIGSKNSNDARQSLAGFGVVKRQQKGTHFRVQAAGQGCANDQLVWAASSARH